MKFIAILLLAANLMLFGWLYTHQDSYRPALTSQAKQFPAPVEPLVLLHERSKPDTAVRTPQQPANAVDMPEEIPAAVPETQTTNAPVTTEIPENITAETAAAEGNATPSPMAPVTETESEIAAEAPPQAASALAPQPVAAPIRICQTLGPFPDRQGVDGFVNELTAMGLEPAVRTVQIEQPSGYWVYLPSMPRTDARRIVDELANKGVRDYFLGRQNFISLGVFSDKRSAEVRVREIVGMGYQPHLEPRFLTRDVYWIDLEERGPAPISDARWQALLEPLTDIRRQPLACE